MIRMKAKHEGDGVTIKTKARKTDAEEMLGMAIRIVKLIAKHSECSIETVLKDIGTIIAKRQKEAETQVTANDRI